MVIFFHCFLKYLQIFSKTYPPHCLLIANVSKTEFVSMADWDEIKRLAADFQKVQLTSTTQRLSERNCVEIVTWLIQRKMIDLIFTNDGKEYMTPSHLINDIKAELYVSGGRVNLVELAKTIGVDLSHVTAHVNDITRGHKDIHLVLGHIIDSNYTAKIAGEINEKLQQQGLINLNDLTIQYNLPAEFLQHVVEKYLGKLILGKQDKSDARVFFTETFLERMKAKIRGALVGLTKPTPITVILNHTDVSEKLFFSLFDQASPAGILTTRLPGAQFIPNIYSRTQNEWVNNFYKQNGYLEFDVLSRLGISDYKSYLKKQLTNEEVSYLNSCIISKQIVERVEADIEECINSKSFLDLQTNLPSVFNEKDLQLVAEVALNTQKRRETIVIENYIISKAFINNLLNDCKEQVQKNARSAVDTGKYQLYQTELQVSRDKPSRSSEDIEDTKADRKEERRKKAASGKSGGGTQGRETKMKSTKKHPRGNTRNVSGDDDPGIPEKKASLEIISLEDIISIIQDKLEDEGLDELLNPIASYLYPSLNEEGLEIASTLYASTVSDRTAIRRHTHNELQNTLNLLISDVRLFEKGVKLLPAEVQPQLHKYLLKTLCTDIVSEILNYISAEENINTVTNDFTTEQRIKFVNELPSSYKASMQVLVKSLAGQDIEEFMKAVEDVLTTCSMILKKIDKKKDRITVLNHRHGLLEQLNKCDDPALVLHLTVLIIFISATQNMLHVSGRHVAAILSFLKEYLSAEEVGELSAYHDLVTLMLSGGVESENAKEQLVLKMHVIKTIANEYKKPTT